MEYLDFLKSWENLDKYLLYAYHTLKLPMAEIALKSGVTRQHVYNVVKRSKFYKGEEDGTNEEVSDDASL